MAVSPTVPFPPPPQQGRIFHPVRGTFDLRRWLDCPILGGRDAVLEGTWLGVSEDGKVAFLTNVRELYSLNRQKNRGELPVRFLSGRFSTRRSDAVSVNTNGEVAFYSRWIAGDWYERTETFKIKETEDK